eukprot:g4581.t1
MQQSHDAGPDDRDRSESGTGTNRRGTKFNILGKKRARAASLRGGVDRSPVHGPMPSPNDGSTSPSSAAAGAPGAAPAQPAVRRQSGSFLSRMGRRFSSRPHRNASEDSVGAARVGASSRASAPSLAPTINIVVEGQPTNPTASCPSPMAPLPKRAPGAEQKPLSRGALTGALNALDEVDEGRASEDGAGGASTSSSAASPANALSPSAAASLKGLPKLRPPGIAVGGGKAGVGKADGGARESTASKLFGATSGLRSTYGGTTRTEASLSESSTDSHMTASSVESRGHSYSLDSRSMSLESRGSGTPVGVLEAHLAPGTRSVMKGSFSRSVATMQEMFQDGASPRSFSRAGKRELQGLFSTFVQHQVNTGGYGSEDRAQNSLRQLSRRCSDESESEAGGSERDVLASPHAHAPSPLGSEQEQSASVLEWEREQRKRVDARRATETEEDDAAGASGTGVQGVAAHTGRRPSVHANVRAAASLSDWEREQTARIAVQQLESASARSADSARSDSAGPSVAAAPPPPPAAQPGTGAAASAAAAMASAGQKLKQGVALAAEMAPWTITLKALYDWAVRTAAEDRVDSRAEAGAGAGAVDVDYL